MPCDVPLPPFANSAATQSQSVAEAEHESKPGPSSDSDIPYSGRLEAIKLSGDVHVPRAEYTFIAPDIGDAGTLRVEDEEPFKGARVVRAAGHIADRGFQHGESHLKTLLR